MNNLPQERLWFRNLVQRQLQFSYYKNTCNERFYTNGRALMCVKFRGYCTTSMEVHSRPRGARALGHADDDGGATGAGKREDVGREEGGGRREGNIKRKQVGGEANLHCIGKKFPCQPPSLPPPTWAQREGLSVWQPPPRLSMAMAPFSACSAAGRHRRFFPTGGIHLPGKNRRVVAVRRSASAGA